MWSGIAVRPVRCWFLRGDFASFFDCIFFVLHAISARKLDARKLARDQCSRLFTPLCHSTRSSRTAVKTITFQVCIQPGRACFNSAAMLLQIQEYPYSTTPHRDQKKADSKSAGLHSSTDRTLQHCIFFKHHGRLGKHKNPTRTTTSFVQAIAFKREPKD